MTAALAPTDRLATLPDGIPEFTLGFGVARWLMENLRQPNGPAAGQAFDPTDGQIRFLLWWYALDEQGRWLFQHGVRRLGKGSGKSPSVAAFALAELCGPVRFDRWDSSVPGGVVGKPVSMPLVQIAATAESQPLALDTPVPTPDGYRTIGDLRVGDRVFGSDGSPVVVRRTTRVLHDQDCYRVIFDDDEQIVASGAHGWTVSRANSHDRRRELVTTTTAQMAGDYLQNDGGARYSMPVVGVEYPKVDDLPVDPYLLGLWLGDGTTKDASIAFDTRDEDETLRLVRDCLKPHDHVVVEHGPGHQGRLRVRLVPGLCRWGHDCANDRVRNGRHDQCGECLRTRTRSKVGSPLLTLRERLRAAGVLGRKHIPDTYLRSHHDQRLALLQGLIDSDGGISPRGLASFTNRNDDLFDDVHSLVVSLGYKVDTQPATGGARVLKFSPTDGRVVARLPRKAARHQVRATQRSWERRIRRVERVPSVPVRCIGIDTPDHLFVVGHHNTLTHNTENTMRMVRAFAPKGSKVATKYGLDPGKQQYNKAPEGTLRVLTSSSHAAEGAESSFVVADEVEWWVPGNGGPQFHSTLLDNLTKSGSRMIETCNAWVPGIGSVAEQTWDAWVAQEEARFPAAQRILYDARVAPPDTDLADDASLSEALEWVYEDCWWQDIAPIKARIWSPNAAPDESRRKYLNQPTASAYSWVTPQEWSKLADPTHVVPDGADVVLFFDGSKSRDATALVGCEVESGHVFTLGVWEPDPSHDADDTVNAEAVDAAVAAAYERYTVLAHFADVREWESFALTEWPRRHGADLLLWAAPSSRPPQPIAWDMRSHTVEFARAAEACHEEITGGEFTHDGHPVTARHVGNAHRHPTRGMISVSKESPDSSRKVDACVSVIGARMVRRMLLGSKEYQKRQRRARGRGRVIVLS